MLPGHANSFRSRSRPRHTSRSGGKLDRAVHARPQDSTGVNLTSDQIVAGSAAVNAASAIAVAILTAGLLSVSRRLRAIEEQRERAVFELDWSEIHPLALYTTGDRDFMIHLTNRGGHASSIRRTWLDCVDGTGVTKRLPVRLTQPDGSDFASLNIQPGERLKSRARFKVPEGYTLGGKAVTLHVEPVIGALVKIEHNFDLYHAQA